jgi:phage gpG-like protein
MEFRTTIDASIARERLSQTPGRVFNALQERMVIEMGRLANYVKAEKLSGQVLHNRTGNLRNSVFSNVEVTGTQIVGTVDVSMPAAMYGAAHEFGAHIPERRPVNARALHWIGSGGDVFAMRASAFDLPERPFMAPSLDENQEQITAGLQASINGVLV